MKKVLITGALGQIGTELAVEFNKRYGAENVVVSDVNNDVNGALPENAFERLDVTDPHAL
jgi:nucleoside-diphosphate-sugar epimerase